MFFVIGIGSFDMFPKSWTVIHLFEVGEFMDDDVVHDIDGSEQDFGGKIEIAVARATAPATVGILEADIIDLLLIEFFVVGMYSFAEGFEYIAGDPA